MELRQCGYRYTNLEHHHSDWFPRQGITDDELRNHIEAYLLIRDRLDHTNRHRVYQSYDMLSAYGIAQ